MTSQHRLTLSEAQVEFSRGCTLPSRERNLSGLPLINDSTQLIDVSESVWIFESTVGHRGERRRTVGRGIESDIWRVASGTTMGAVGWQCRKTPPLSRLNVLPVQMRHGCRRNGALTARYGLQAYKYLERIFDNIRGGNRGLPLEHVWGRGRGGETGIKGWVGILNEEDEPPIPFIARLLSIMPGKKWTTPEQLSFLEAQIPDYLAAQSEGRLTNFYSALTHQFFTRWSERALRFPPTIEGETRTLSRTEELELSPFIIRRKEVHYESCHATEMYILTSTLVQQIRSWFSWHSKTQLRKKPTLASLQSFGQKTQKTRLMHPSEVYSSLYYDTKIKPRVLEEKGDRDLSRGEHLSLVKSITQEMFAAESAEVKEEVADKLTSMKAIRQKEREEKEDEDNETGSSSSSSERRPEEYQRYVHTHFAYSLYLQPTPQSTSGFRARVWTCLG
jgi:hypothetical protein